MTTGALQNVRQFPSNYTDLIQKAIHRRIHDLDMIAYLRWSKIAKVCPGYSRGQHWHFFHWLIKHHPIESVLMLGVYYGRDIAFLVSAFEKHRPSADYAIIGVDLFADIGNADWPPHLANCNWEAAGYGPPPRLESAEECLRLLNAFRNVTLVRDSAANFLHQTRQKFDFIYIDLSHDYETTAETIALSIPNLKEDGIIGGDDFVDHKTWGVESAVKENFGSYALFGSSIWYAKKAHFSGASGSAKR